MSRAVPSLRHGRRALIDTFGDGYVERGLALGIRPDRINTIVLAVG
jgi:hypothetical protein